MATDEPPWLSAWRGADAPAQPAQPAAQQRSQGAGRGGGTSSTASTTAAAAQRVSAGFSEPTPWPWDGGKRREAVHDIDHNPPRFVRRVGWHLCLRCAKPFWSVDVLKVRMCDPCKNTEGNPFVP